MFRFKKLLTALLIVFLIQSSICITFSKEKKIIQWKDKTIDFQPTFRTIEVYSNDGASKSEIEGFNVTSIIAKKDNIVLFYDHYGLGSDRINLMNLDTLKCKTLTPGICDSYKVTDDRIYLTIHDLCLVKPEDTHLVFDLNGKRLKEGFVDQTSLIDNSKTSDYDEENSVSVTVGEVDGNNQTLNIEFIIEDKLNNKKYTCKNLSSFTTDSNYIYYTDYRPNNNFSIIYRIDRNTGKVKQNKINAKLCSELSIIDGKLFFNAYGYDSKNNNFFSNHGLYNLNLELNGMESKYRNDNISTSDSN